jgi:hypothetical protein
MLIKCICTNCAGHLEFEEENAGENIPCPHCGFLTTLALPGQDKHQEEFLAMIRRRLLRRRVAFAVAGLLVLGAVGYSLHRWAVPWLQDFWPAIDSEKWAWVVFAATAAALPFALAWLVFPVVIWFQIRELTGLLTRLTEQLSGAETGPEAAEEGPAEESDAQVHSKARAIPH